MIPWRVAAGTTLAACAGAFWFARSELPYLLPYAGQLAAAHGARIAVELTLAVATLYCGLYRLASLAGLSRVGRKLEVEQRALERGAGYDPTLAESLERDRSGT